MTHEDEEDFMCERCGLWNEYGFSIYLELVCDECLTEDEADEIVREAK